ncbi:MAG: peptidylprolyl isomerase [Acidobacteriota bacterium]|nr:peptidylprolyl isomerase [Blastocatellia bacterium]MDW8239022.1 peptidylprolyl isomerase [Acidobacteriota bacterium]
MNTEHRRIIPIVGLYICCGLIGALVSQSVAGETIQRGKAKSKQKAAPTASSPPAASTAEPAVSENYENLQAVIVTDQGEIAIEFFPRDAPQHVAHFVQLARRGLYNGTTFHRILPQALIQGGDPLSRDPRTPRHKLGTGGLDQLKAEFNDRLFFRGTVGAVLRPNAPNSAGSQFFICVTDQLHLTREYTAFGRVVRGIEVVEAIAQTPVDANQIAKQRVEIKSVVIRPTLSVADMKRCRVIVQTDRGSFTIGLYPEAAPNHVRRFITLAGGGFYDGTTFHIIMPGYILQGGDPMTRHADRQYWGRGRSGDWLAPEFNQIPFERGTVGMMLMRGESEPTSADSQFFICLAPAPHLNGKFTAWGRVLEGMEVLDQIAALKTDAAHAPIEPVVLRRFQVVTDADAPPK